MSASITLILTHNANGGTGGPTTTSIYGSYTTAGTKTLTVNASSAKPTRTGYNFTGWSPSSVTKSYTFTQSQIDSGAHVQINATTTAQWSIKKYTVTYNANGGTEAPASQTKTYGKALTLSTEQPSRYGYKFLRWNTAADGSGTNYAGGASYNSNSNLTLYAIWQNISSYPTVTSGDIGDGKTISITDRDSSAASYDVSYSFGNAKGTIATKTTSKSLSWTPAMSLCSQIPNSTSGTCTITVKAYDANGNDIGTDTGTCTLRVPASVVPSVDSCNFIESADAMLALNWGIFVQSKSEIVVAANASGVYGSSIDSWAINVNGTNYTGSGAITAKTAAITASGTLSCTVTVNDSRGRSMRETYTFYVYPYSSPAMPVRNVQHDDDTEDIFVLEYRWNIFPCNNKNTKKLEYRYAKVETGVYSGWITLTTGSYQPTNNTVTRESVADSDNYDYYIQYRVTDSFTSVVYTLTVPNQSSTIMDICPQYSTVAFGMKCVEDDYNHINKATKFHHGVFDGKGESLWGGNNLIANGWATVNQRGFTSANLSGSSSEDNWVADCVYARTDNGVSVKFENTGAGIKITPPQSDTAHAARVIYDIPQFRKLVGRQLTLSVLIDSNTYTDSVRLAFTTSAGVHGITTYNGGWTDIPAKATGIFSHTVILGSIADTDKYLKASATLRNTGTGFVNIKAVKVELGGQSTLSNDCEPEYYAERAKCISQYYKRDNANAFEAGLGMTFDLVWKNPDTTATFAAQKIPIDLTDYKWIGVVITSAYNSDAQYKSCVLLMPKDGRQFHPTVMHRSGNYNFMRSFKAEDDGVTVTTGYRNGSSGTGYAIPCEIYGIRGVN